MNVTHIVNADEFQRIQPRNHKPFRNQIGKCEANWHPDQVLDAVQVHLCSRTKHHDCRHKRDEQRQRGRYDTKPTISHDKLFGGALATTRERVIKADADRCDEKHGQKRVVGPLQHSSIRIHPRRLNRSVLNRPLHMTMR